MTRNNGSCQPRWTTTRPASDDIGTDCTDGADIKYYIRNDAGKFDCYANTCENYDEYELVNLMNNRDFVCSINSQFMSLGKCIKKEINCSDTTEIQNACTAWQNSFTICTIDSLFGILGKIVSTLIVSKLAAPPNYKMVSMITAHARAPQITIPLTQRLGMKSVNKECSAIMMSTIAHLITEHVGMCQ